MAETTAPYDRPFSYTIDWDPPPYVPEHTDLAALRVLPPKARARRVAEIVAERNPKLARDSVSFGRLVGALTDLAEPKPLPRRKPHARPI